MAPPSAFPEALLDSKILQQAMAEVQWAFRVARTMEVAVLEPWEADISEVGQAPGAVGHTATQVPRATELAAAHSRALEITPVGVYQAAAVPWGTPVATATPITTTRAGNSCAAGSQTKATAVTGTDNTHFMVK